MKCLHFSHMTPINLNGRKASSWRKGIIPECVNNSRLVATVRTYLCCPSSAVSLGEGPPKSDPTGDVLELNCQGLLGAQHPESLLWPTWSPPALGRVGSAVLIGKPIHCWLNPLLTTFSSPMLEVTYVTLELKTGLGPEILFLCRVDCVGCCQGPGAGQRSVMNLTVCSSPLPPPRCRYLHPFKSDWSGQGIFGGEKP